MKNTFVIGDIHGGLRALEQVLEKAGVSAGDTLIFLGDYVDGWSESAQTIEFLLQRSQLQPCIFIKGNHDEWCEEWLHSGQADKTWLLHGGQATIKSYAATDETNRNRHRQFFGRLKGYYVDDRNRLFVHAGFTAPEGPEKEFDPSDLSWDRTLWETALALAANRQEASLLFPQRLELFYEIYIGHTPTLHYNMTVPMQARNVWNIDTGAAFTGRLTIMDIDTKRCWQSDPVKNLYPTETGRNKD